MLMLCEFGVTYDVVIGRHDHRTEMVINLLEDEFFSRGTFSSRERKVIVLCDVKRRRDTCETMLLRKGMFM